VRLRQCERDAALVKLAVELLQRLTIRTGGAAASINSWTCSRRKRALAKKSGASRR
jgi:hypothetical protein